MLVILDRMFPLIIWTHRLYGKLASISFLLLRLGLYIPLSLDNIFLVLVSYFLGEAILVRIGYLFFGFYGSIKKRSPFLGDKSKLRNCYSYLVLVIGFYRPIDSFQTFDWKRWENRKSRKKVKGIHGLAFTKIEVLGGPNDVLR